MHLNTNVQGMPKRNEMEARFVVGDEVEKTTGDYTFRGQVRAAFTKKNGAVRYVVENEDGLLHIFSDGNLGDADNAS